MKKNLPKEKISTIKNYINEFKEIDLISIDENNFTTFCKIHNSTDFHKTKTFGKNYIKRNASPCKYCRNKNRIEKIKKSLNEKFAEKRKLSEENKVKKREEKKYKEYEEQIKRANLVHNNFYSYKNVTPENFKNQYWSIICPEHGEFKQLKKDHLKGHKCFQCYIKSISFHFDFFTNFLRDNPLIEIKREDYKGYDKLSKFKCKKHGYFYAIPEKLLKRGIEYGCKKCLSNKGLWENDIKDFLENELNISNIERNKKIKTNNGKNFEIDIYCPDYNIGIECNGIYWHSDKFCDKNYHLRKTNECEKIGIKLIQIFEDEWKTKKEIVKNILKTIFKKNNKVIYARKLKIEIIPENVAKRFYDKFHIQGWCRSSISLGAFNEFYQLVACMSFSNKRPGIGSKKAKNIVELTRYATDGGRYPGLATKFFKHYLENFHKGGKIITYADRRFYNGNVYLQMGFKLKRITGPNYFYIIGNKRLHRYNFSKIRLKKIFDSEEKICSLYTEREIMEGLGIPKVFDCGHIVFEFEEENEQKK